MSVHPGAVATDMEKSGLAGALPDTKGELVGKFVTWLVADDAVFVAGQFVWVNWDISELLKKQAEICRERFAYLDIVSTSVALFQYI